MASNDTKNEVSEFRTIHHRLTFSSVNSPSLQEEVLFTTMGDSEKGGCYRLITLNRPKALNALNYNMIRLITADMKVCEIYVVCGV